MSSCHGFAATRRSRPGPARSSPANSRARSISRATTPTSPSREPTDRRLRSMSPPPTARCAIRGARTDTRVDARNAEVIARGRRSRAGRDLQRGRRVDRADRAAAAASSSTRSPPPAAITAPASWPAVKTEGNEQHASGPVNGGGPTITLRSTQGEIVVRDADDPGACRKRLRPPRPTASAVGTETERKLELALDPSRPALTRADLVSFRFSRGHRDLHQHSSARNFTRRSHAPSPRQGPRRLRRVGDRAAASSPPIASRRSTTCSAPASPTRARC